MASNLTIPNTISTQAGGTNVTPLLDANYTALVNAANNLNSASNYYADTGTANALVITIPAGQSFTVTDGLELSVKAANANTGAATITVNGTQYPIQAIGGAALSAGSIGANEVIKLIYNAAASAFHLQTASATVGTLVSEVVVTATGAYSVTVPAGATMCAAELVGGGGSTGNGTPSGGGGAYTRKIFGVAAGALLTGQVGAGGAQNNSSIAAAGGATTLSSPALTAGGGAGGGTSSGAGGAASGGDVNIAGQSSTSSGFGIYNGTSIIAPGGGNPLAPSSFYANGTQPGQGSSYGTINNSGGNGIAIFKFYK